MQHTRRFRRPGPKRGWANPRAQLAAQAAKQAARMDTPIDVRGDGRETLRLRIETADGRVIVDWALVPRQGNLRQYRVLDWHTRQPVMIEGKALGGGKDKIGREAIKLMPTYAGNLDEPQGYSARDEAGARAAHEGRCAPVCATAKQLPLHYGLAALPHDYPPRFVGEAQGPSGPLLLALHPAPALHRHQYFTGADEHHHSADAAQRAAVKLSAHGRLGRSLSHCRH